MSHPGDLLWIDGTGITRRKLSDIQHWRDMQRFMANPDEAVERLLSKLGADDTAETAYDANQSDLVGEMSAARPAKPSTTVAKRKRLVRLWVMSDLHFEAVPHPEGFRPVRPEFDVLVVAGDVWEGHSRRALEIVATLANGKPAVFVMGNHEPWNVDLQHERDVGRRAAKSLGITLLDDSEAEVAGLSLVGGTLCADGRLAGEDAAPTRETGEQIMVLKDGATRLITSADEGMLHARTRDELLNEVLFGSIRHARALLNDWRRDYNEQRPNSKLAWATPTAFAILAHAETGRGAALRQGSAPRPLASTETQGSNQPSTTYRCMKIGGHVTSPPGPARRALGREVLSAAEPVGAEPGQGCRSRRCLQLRHAGGVPVPWQKVLNFGDFCPACDNPLQHIGKVCKRVVSVRPSPCSGIDDFCRIC